MDPQVTQLQKHAAEREDAIGYSNTPLDRIDEGALRLACTLDAWR